MRCCRPVLVVLCRFRPLFAIPVQLKRQVHRLRKQYDDLRAENKEKTAEVQAVQAELAKLDRLASVDKTDDAFRTKARIEDAENRYGPVGLLPLL
jgi:cell division protein FtsB